MVRRARIEVEGGIYHVYNRVSSGEHIFADPQEAKKFIEIVRLGATLRICALLL